MKKIILNTDIGGDFDDSLALLLAMNSSEVELTGVITTKEHIRDKAKFAKNLLNLAGRPEVPVFYDGQLKEKKDKYISVYDYGLLSEEDLQKDDHSFGISNKGIDFIIDSVHKYPGQINLVSIAPNTNLAAAMQKDPSIVSKIRSVYLMGGALNRDGEDIDRPEHNYMRDRKAFDYVTEQDIPIYLIPRNITQDLFLDPEVIKQKIEGSDFYKTFYKLADTFLSYNNWDSFRLSDPITVGSLLFPDLFKEQKVNLVKLKGEQGEVVSCMPTEQSNVTVFYDFDRTGFYEKLKQRL
ncbi:nucleoside hydrolase [Candidatus Woesearchaeota archaeon]|nr:nucleoside hydrolase [Candidatus Woesearchaeota archaeon]